MSRFLNSSWELRLSVSPASRSTARTSSVLITVAVASCRRSTMALGVPAGANNPSQMVASKSLTPASSNVGRSGKSRERIRVVTASARKRPALICGSAAVTPRKPMDTCPPMTSASA
ncbi:hypothetical protein D3C71_1720000 [compost metagenome]